MVTVREGWILKVREASCLDHRKGMAQAHFSNFEPEKDVLCTGGLQDEPWELAIA